MDENATPTGENVAGASGEFTMADATFGRDRAGAESLKANLLGDIDTAIHFLTDSTEYTTLINTVEKNWQGADATAFLNEFKNATANLANSYRSYKTIIENAVDTDAKNFSQLQERNAEQINGISSQFQ